MDTPAGLLPPRCPTAAAALLASRAVAATPPSTPAPPALRPRPVARLWGTVSGHRWALAFAAVVGAIAVRNLMGLSTTPSGLYADEASIGYNAWSIAHFGVDEHGASLPLFFQAFGEWKNPVYIYALVPFVWLFGLTTAVVRTPAALFGIVTAIALAGFARRATGSKGVALATLLVAGATPWLSLQSRVAFEVPSMVTCLALMLWCLARAAEASAGRRWFGFSGLALGLGVFAYTVGRLEGALLAAAVVLCFGGWRRLRRFDAFIALVAAAYLLLALWAMRHPGQLTFYFNSISIAAGHPPLWTVVGRFAGNMAAYFGPAFLFVSGDPNLRQSTGFGGSCWSRPSLSWSPASSCASGGGGSPCPALSSSGCCSPPSPRRSPMTGRRTRSATHRAPLLDRCHRVWVRRPPPPARQPAGPHGGARPGGGGGGGRGGRDGPLHHRPLRGIHHAFRGLVRRA